MECFKIYTKQDGGCNIKKSSSVIYVCQCLKYSSCKAVDEIVPG